MTSYRNYVDALRAVIVLDRNEPEMRDIARNALKLLDEDMVVEAALTHLTSLARSEYNRQIREQGTTSPNSDEVVNVRGTDVFLGATSESDREWLARSRETLADGLQRRADHLRTYGATGPAVTAKLTTSEVLRLERRAAEVERLADALDVMTVGLGTGDSPIERHIAEAIREANEHRDAMLRLQECYRMIGERAVKIDAAGSVFAGFRRAIRIMADDFGIEGVDDGEGEAETAR